MNRFIKTTALVYFYKVNKPLFYATGGLNISVGSTVLAPYRNEQKKGIVLSLSSENTKQHQFELKNITTILQEPSFFNDQIIPLIDKIAKHHMCSIETIMPLFFPRFFWQNLDTNLSKNQFYDLHLPATAPKSLCSVHQKLLPFSKHPFCFIHQYQINLLNISTSTTDKLINLAWLTPTKPKNLPNFSVGLSQAQNRVVDEISKKFSENKFCSHYIHGITGSGKTHVYLKLAVDQINLGFSVILLVPEISLTPQLLSRIHKVIPEQYTGAIHSQLTEKQKKCIWSLASLGVIKLLIGTRSSLFTPMKNLNLIIIDEEHDLSYKQSSGIKYHTRTMAYIMAKHLQIPLLMGSATPSLSCAYKINNHQLKASYLLERFQNASTPQLHIHSTDGKKNISGIASDLLEKIKHCLQSGQKALVYINRRGFSPAVWCPHCQHVQICEGCDGPLVYHKEDNQSRCHRCDIHVPFFKTCQMCGQNDNIGVGQGTEKVAHTLTELLPNFPVIQIDKDHCENLKKLNTTLNVLYENKPLCIVCTQLLIKSHHIPNLSMAVFMQADASLYSKDFRSKEYLLQEITQLSGRVGRDQTQSTHVYIQTDKPSHAFWKLLTENNYMDIAKTLLLERVHAKLPPIKHHAAFHFYHKNKQKALEHAQTIYTLIKSNPSWQILPPMESFTFKRQYTYRYVLILQADLRPDLYTGIHTLQKTIIKHLPNPNKITSFDLDPVSI